MLTIRITLTIGWNRISVRHSKHMTHKLIFNVQHYLLCVNLIYGYCVYLGHSFENLHCLLRAFNNRRYRMNAISLADLTLCASQCFVASLPQQSCCCCIVVLRPR